MSDEKNIDETVVNGVKVSCVIDEERGKRTYRATSDASIVSLSFDEKGYVRLCEGENEVARLHIDTGMAIRNVGGAEQYKSVRKPMCIRTVNDLMDIYHKIQEQKFTTYDSTGNNLLQGEEKRKVGKLMTGFLDTYIFSNPASREVLDEYLAKAAEEDRKRENLSAGVYMRALNSRKNSK